MLRRFPHIAEIRVVTEQRIPGGLNPSSTDVFQLKGRFEPEASRRTGIDYKAKFYCNNVREVVSKFLEPGLFPVELMAHEGMKDLAPFSLDGQTLRIHGKDFEIVMLHNYQTHCELWLE